MGLHQRGARRVEPSRVVHYENPNGKFRVECGLLDDDTILMTKFGRENYTDAQREVELVDMLMQKAGLERPPRYLIVDLTEFKSLSRAARKFQSQFTKNLPFQMVAVFGLSASIRLLARIFSAPNSKIRFFSDFDSALALTQRHRGENTISPSEVADLQTFVGADPVAYNRLLHEQSQYSREVELAGQTRTVINPPAWQTSYPDIPFESEVTLIDRDIILTRSVGICTGALIKEGATATLSMLDTLQANRVYFIHETKELASIPISGRLEIRNRMRAEQAYVELAVLIAKPYNTVAIRWMKMLAPKIFARWMTASSVEQAVEIIDRHREARDHNPQNPSARRDARKDNALDLDRVSDLETLRSTIKSQRSQLVRYERLMDFLVEKSGAFAWGELKAPDPPFEIDDDSHEGLVIGALELMASDITDIMTELNEQMEELRESRRQLAVSQRVAQLGGFELSVVDDTLTCTDELLRIFGYTRADAPSDWFDWLSHLPALRNSDKASFIASLSELPDQFDGEYEMVTGANERRFVSVRGRVAARDPFGRPVHFHGTVRDVTTVVEANRAERKANADRLAQDEALRATLLDLSHDLKTPLASLKLGLGRLHAQPQNPQVARALRAEVEYLDALCSNFVSLIRYTAAPPERNLVELDINDVVERVVTRLSIIASDAQIGLAHAACEDDSETVGDALALEQAIGNVVHNAIKFAEANVAVLVTRTDEELAIAVRDDGPGVPNLSIPKLTERFFRVVDRPNSTGRGLGLGLPIAKAIITDHGGNLVIANMPGGGTSVTLTIPIQRPAR